jgi:uncharacterized protein YjbI with pentapeptide repeats
MDLTGVDFTAATLTGTSLRSTNLCGATFDVPPRWSTDRSLLTDLSGATINYAQTCHT